MINRWDWGISSLFRESSLEDTHPWNAGVYLCYILEGSLCTRSECRIEQTTYQHRTSESEIGAHLEMQGCESRRSCSDDGSVMNLRGPVDVLGTV